jgi:RNA polymerase sigma-70 factor (ECF subfamily)
MTGTTSVDTAAAELGFEQYRPELTGYCYRMLGSAFEADDAVQETLVRAWRAFDRFEGRAAVRSWLYKIASNVCFDMLKGRNHRALPMDVTEMGHAEGHVDPPDKNFPWLGPVPDARITSVGADPAEQAELRESVRLAFVAALQHLPARQRAVLILREVLKWHASEVAELLDTTVVSVNSALQRARATLAERNVTAGSVPPNVDPEQEALLARYVDAFERFDIDSLVALLHEDVTMQMPPYPLWMRGADQYRIWLTGPGYGCRGSRLARIGANGQPAFAQWRVDPDGGYAAWSLHVLTIEDGAITAQDFFVDPDLFALFDLPVHLDA